MRILRVAGAQMGPIQKADSRQVVVARMIDLLDQAKAQNCDLVIYPELSLTTFFPRWYMTDQMEVDTWFEREMPNAVTRPLFERATAHGIGLSFGYAELTLDGHHFNTAILVDRTGRIVGKYRKVHLPGHAEFDPQRTFQHLEKRYFEPGDLGFPVWRTVGGIIGMCICNDRRWPETYRVMGLQGVELIALGYNMGRYQGDLGAHVEDFKIFICDPNFPGQMRTLIPDTGRKIYHYQEGGTETWRTYFVDKNYHANQPPAIPNASYPKDDKVYELVLDFFTGGDDLRGGNDNVDLVVNLTDGRQQAYSNINLESRWVVNNDESAEVILQSPVRQEELRSLEISTTFQGGSGGDNWDMNQLVVSVLGGGFFRQIKTVGFKKFTGDDKVLLVPITTVEFLAGIAANGSINVYRYNPTTNWTVGNITWASMVGPLTSWIVGDVWHLAGVGTDQNLYVLWQSPGHDWQAANISKLTGATVVGSVTSWVVGDVEHLAGRGVDGSVYVFWISPSQNWQAANVSQLTGLKVTSGLVPWQLR